LLKFSVQDRLIFLFEETWLLKIYNLGMIFMRLINIRLTDRPDIFKWSLNSNGQFSINLIYQAFIDTNIVPNNSYLWTIRIPLKIKVFIWLLYREAILTKDNLVKRNWHGMLCVTFVIVFETIQHLFFDCVLGKFIWSHANNFWAFNTD
jgi:hypothetical protein